MLDSCVISCILGSLVAVQKIEMTKNNPINNLFSVKPMVSIMAKERLTPFAIHHDRCYSHGHRGFRRIQAVL